jgi:hypothetical protein
MFSVVRRRLFSATVPALSTSKGVEDNYKLHPRHSYNSNNKAQFGPTKKKAKEVKTDGEPEKTSNDIENTSDVLYFHDPHVNPDASSSVWMKATAENSGRILEDVRRRAGKDLENAVVTHDYKHEEQHGDMMPADLSQIIASESFNDRLLLVYI